ncbi:MAG: MBL fold metallo-hydrolase [Syntrophobacterales bacterium]|nr:MBL fold metallo-hydrolase [Syntrophobacterales bacterium]
MKITPLGAAGQVTGSCHLIETSGMKYLVDCGLFQGGKRTEELNWEPWAFNPSEIGALFLTHAHIDHCGRIPKLVKDGFRGKIYATRPTIELCKILLLDSAHIQESYAELKTRKNLRRGLPPTKPLYTEAEAIESFAFMEPIEPNRAFSVSENLKISFRTAGHILGASILEIWAREEDTEQKVVFSGDIGRNDQLIVKDPEEIFEADALFLESTYGNRNHKTLEESKSELKEAILYSYGHRQKVLIPSFAVERTQEILYVLREFFKDRLIPDMPVFLDSPLAIQATKIFSQMQEFFDEETRAIIARGEDPFLFPQLHFSQTVDDSRRINMMEGPAIIIAGNGMCTAGRILHHIKHNIWREGCSLVIVGFQAEGSLGRQIIDGAKRIRVMGEDVAVRTKVFTIGGFSSHAGQDELIEWVSNFKKREMKVFLIHGEKTASEALSFLIREKLGLWTYIPHMGETLIIEPVKPEVLPEDICENYLYEIGKRFFELEHNLMRSLPFLSMEKKKALAERLKRIQQEIEDTMIFSRR